MPACYRRRRQSLTFQLLEFGVVKVQLVTRLRDDFPLLWSQSVLSSLILTANPAFAVTLPVAASSKMARKSDWSVGIIAGFE